MGKQPGMGRGVLPGGSPAGGEEARKYFSSLPRNVQEMVVRRRDRIRSEDELRRYAENLAVDDPQPRA